MKNINYLLGLTVLLLFVGCKNKSQKWNYVTKIDLGSITPIGLSVLDNHLWVSDGDNNQLVQLDNNGTILSKKDGFERPMHIATDGVSIYVPEYGKDQITVVTENKQSSLKLTDSLDAPAGIHLADGKFAIADFYNHRILYGSDIDWISFGKEGKADGEFYYPTDVHIANQKIYVADAYNNRVQIFDFEGNHLSTFGKEEKMNASTGIYVSSSQIFITDFEHDRVLVYDLEGMLLQEIKEGLEKPTDVLLNNDILYIANYKGKNLIKFRQ
jgi:DNA-binding beta-propeller fold protein YncE